MTWRSAGTSSVHACVPYAVALCVGWSRLTLAAAPVSVTLEVSPSHVELTCPEASQQLLVTGVRSDSGANVADLQTVAAQVGRLTDLTRAVRYESADTTVATVDNRGRVRPLRDGQTTVLIHHGDLVQEIPVRVHGLAKPAPVSFQQDIVPIMTKTGCNGGGCHGKAEGQNGFKLSLFGFDAPFDHAALVQQSRGRRLSLGAPERSLTLLKATNQLPHGGGQRMDPQSLHYARFVRWITEGAQLDRAGVVPTFKLEIQPTERSLGVKTKQQIAVTAVDVDGNRRCVTAEAEYSSNAATVAGVDGDGYVSANDVPGEAAILVRYMGAVAVCRITVPRVGSKFERPAEQNFIDRLVWNKLERLGISPSELSSDAVFLRRVYLDTIGTLPTAEEARAFLANRAPDKRAHLIDALLERPEYGDYWAMRWSDLMRVDKAKIQMQGAVAMSRWLRRQLAENRPYDQIVRDVVTAQGDSFAEGPAAFFKALDTPDLASRAVSQLFLGVRIECAECHHHPFEKWAQDDYYAFAGFFTGVQHGSAASGGDMMLVSQGNNLKHPRTAAIVPTKALGAPEANLEGLDDRRTALADWITSPDNSFFAPAIANRLWAHYLGRGLVEPIDDMRATNPASNEPLLEALAQHMKDVKYDLRAFTRTILNSRVYQLSAITNDTNATDEQNFSHATNKALPAEVLLDAVCQVTGVSEKFHGWPEGYRAIHVWDNLMPNYFFRIFGRPVRASVCECDRSTEPSIAQALHLMNSPEIAVKIESRRGHARRLSNSDASPSDIIDELYLSCLSRNPQASEREAMLRFFANGDRRIAAQDVMWTLLNSKEFLYSH